MWNTTLGWNELNKSERFTTVSLKVNPVPRTPRFYITPKIHKRGNPGYPVVSSFNYHTVNISKYIGYHLQPIVKLIPSYIKDTNDLTNKINDIGNIPPNRFLVTMDVKSLYTNIQNLERIAAAQNASDNYPKESIATKVRTHFLALILTLNIYIYIFNTYLTANIIFKWKGMCSV